MNSELLLHLPLNGFEVERDPVSGQDRQVVRDVSGQKKRGEILGTVEVVEDEYFGACASFDGSENCYVSIPQVRNNTDNFTVQAWVNLRELHENRPQMVRIVGRGSYNERSYGLWYQPVSNCWLFQTSATPERQSGGPAFDIPTGSFDSWYHLAGVNDGANGYLYVHDLQGNCVGRAVKGDMTPPPSFDAEGAHEPLTIGCGADSWERTSPTGKIAHVRVYNGARTQEEIERDIAQDRLSLVPFRRSHPIEFRLFDDDDQSVLYINDDPAAPPHLHLELHNTSTQSIQFSPGENGPDTPASPTNHHFAVHFRPGTLSDNTLAWLIDPVKRDAKLKEFNDSTDQWGLYFPPAKPAANQAAVLYLLYKGPKALFEPNDRIQLVLPKMTAAPGNGARGTLVELIPCQLTAAGDDRTPITGRRTQYVHITDHTGRKNIPLHLWFDGGNTVLNDGSPTTLKLCIGNGSNETDITLAKNSRFSLSFDVGDVQDAGWTLTNAENAKAVEVIAAAKDVTIVRGEDNGLGAIAVRHWDLIPRERVLGKRGGDGHSHLNVSIENIVVHKNEVGHANLYVQYKIPGYQPGQFILTVEKSPLVVRGGNVGIGRIPKDQGPNSLQLASGPPVRAIVDDLSLADVNRNVTLPTVNYLNQCVQRLLNLSSVALLDSRHAELMQTIGPTVDMSNNRARFAGRVRMTFRTTCQSETEFRKEEHFLDTFSAYNNSPILRLSPPPRQTHKIKLKLETPDGGAFIPVDVTIATSGNVTCRMNESDFRTLYLKLGWHDAELPQQKPWTLSVNRITNLTSLVARLVKHPTDGVSDQILHRLHGSMSILEEDLINGLTNMMEFLVHMNDPFVTYVRGRMSQSQRVWPIDRGRFDPTDLSTVSQQELTQALLQDLNAIVTGGEFTILEDLKKRQWREEARTLLNYSSRSARETVRLNRLMLEDLFQYNLSSGRRGEAKSLPTLRQIQAALSQGTSTTESIASLSLDESALLIEDLNKLIIDGDAIWNEADFRDVEIRESTRELQNNMTNSGGDQLCRLNRLLLEDAYPTELSRESEQMFLALNEIEYYTWF